MAITIIDPGIYSILFQYYWSHYIIDHDANSLVTGYDLSPVTDAADKAPTFDTQHEVYTNPIVDQASQNSIGDNSNGLQDPLHLDPTLTYTYTTGYSSQHQTSQAVTASVSQDFSYEFLGVGGSTTLSASGTFTWSNGTTDDKTTSVSDSLGAPFDIPMGKIYEEKLLFEQQQVQVPYALIVHLDGPPNGINFTTNEQGLQNENANNPTLFFALSNGDGTPVPAYKNVDWSDFYGQGPYVGDTIATYSLHGTLTIEGASTATVKIYDITHGNSQEVTAEYDPAVSIGVHRTMDDAGRSFRDTPFDDWVDGGAGNDIIRFRGGEDIAHAGDGDDRIVAKGVGRSLLDGGAGDDHIRLVSAAAGNTVLGGDGNDRIRVDAPASMIYGGAGDDRFILNGATAGGTVIHDAEGHNRLKIENECFPLGFERMPHSDHLYILLGGGDSYDSTRDVVWLNFFANPDNRVAGMSVAEIDDLATVFRIIAQAPGPEADALI
jgi:Ca2+-binding RTX toxin-like protein